MSLSIDALSTVLDLAVPFISSLLPPPESLFAEFASLVCNDVSAFGVQGKFEATIKSCIYGMLL